MAGLPKAVVLLSGGLDSATLIKIAQSQGFEVHGLSFDYGQRHNAELKAAHLLAQSFALASHRVMKISLDQFGGSALTDASLEVPHEASLGIPITYVPARNTIFLSFALALAEVLNSQDIFIGVNAVDYSGYPDCRPEFISAFERMANLATKAGVEGHRLKVHTPLMALSKAEIIRWGQKLGVDYSQTVTCYQADAQGRACGVCDACRLRAQGFKQAGLADPTRYQTH